MVGFAAETDDVERYARGKLERKRLDLIAANRVGVAGSGFESDDNALVVYGHDGRARARPGGEDATGRANCSTWCWSNFPRSASALTLHSWPAALAASALTALGCLTLGAALVRLTPLPWLAAGIAAMCIVDVALLATGIGQPAAGQLEGALSHSALPEFHRAQLGSMNRDYPDLVLAAVLGTALAGNARQLTAAVLVAVLASANGALLPGRRHAARNGSARRRGRRRRPARAAGQDDASARPKAQLAPELRRSPRQPVAELPMEA